jgi:uncharacterized membrane protein
MEKASEGERTTGQWVADFIAASVGSWPFLIIQSVILAIWVTLNLVGWFYHWDPYPFILLNLALSFQAAYASPIILMSQNRQAQLNERRNKLDLQINLLAEQENTEMLRLLRLLCKKAGVDERAIDPGRVLEQPIRPEDLAAEIIKHERPAQTNC